MKRWVKYILQFCFYFVGLLLLRWGSRDTLDLNGQVVFIAALFGGMGCLRLYWEGKQYKKKDYEL